MKQLITIILIKILSVVHIVEVYILYKYSFNKGCALVADSKPTNTLFANLIGAKCKDLVPSNKHTTKKGNSIAFINELHAELNK